MLAMHTLHTRILHHDWKRKRWQLVSVLHLATMCLTMDTGQLQIRCELRGRNLYSLWLGTNYGQDISNELQIKIPVMLTKPVHTPEVLARHAI